MLCCSSLHKSLLCNFIPFTEPGVGGMPALVPAPESSLIIVCGDSACRTRIHNKWRSIVRFKQYGYPYFPSFEASWFVVPNHDQLRRMALPPPTTLARYWPWEGLRRWDSVIQSRLQRPRHWLKEWIPTKSVQWIRANSAWDHQLSTSPLRSAPWHTWMHKVGWVWSLRSCAALSMGEFCGLLVSYGEFYGDVCSYGWLILWYRTLESHHLQVDHLGEVMHV